MKYHINENGDVKFCKASERTCPVGREHFESKEDGEKHYERKMTNNAGTINSFSKKNSSLGVNDDGLTAQHTANIHGIDLPTTVSTMITTGFATGVF